MGSQDRAAILATIHESMRSGAPLTKSVRELCDPDLLAMVSMIRCLDRSLFSENSEPSLSPNDSSELQEEPDPSAIPIEPVQVGRFQTVRLLGYGGFGVVFQAYDTQLRRQIALKFPRDDQLGLTSCRESFLREAQATALLEHPLIVPVYEVGEFGATIYIVSALVPGIDLASWLKSHRSVLSVETACQIMRHLAFAMSYIHSRGMAHCDLKPSNVMMVEDDGPYSTLVGHQRWTPRITDFGQAQSISTECDLAPVAINCATRAYMAPEQANSGKITAATDVYLLGVIFYELLAAVSQSSSHPLPSFTESSHPLRLAAVSDTPTFGNLKQILWKCLAENPTDRYQETRSLERDLQTTAEQLPVSLRNGKWTASISKWLPNRYQALVAAFGIIGAIIGTVWFMMSSSRLN